MQPKTRGNWRRIFNWLVTSFIQFCIVMHSHAVFAQEEQCTTVASSAREAIGNLNKLKDLYTLRASGEVQVFGGFPGKFEYQLQLPLNMRLSWDIGYTSHDTAITAGAGWSKKDSVRVLETHEVERARIIPPHFYLATLIEVIGCKRDTLIVSDSRQTKVSDVWVLQLLDQFGGQREVWIDADSHLIHREVRTVVYEEGPQEVVTSFSEYRTMAGLNLPFRWQVSRPDMPLLMHIENYEINSAIAATYFDNPMEDAANDQPYEIALTSLSNTIFAKDDGHFVTGEWYRGWGIPVAPTESWLFHVVVHERYGRVVSPKKVTIDLYAGAELVRTVVYGSKALNAVKSFPAARFNEIAENYNFRHFLTEPKDSGVTHMHYRYQATNPAGELLVTEVDLPIQRYKNKNEYIFPVKGRFAVINAHEHDMPFHTYEKSQYFSYDILPLGEEFELATNNGATSEDFYAFRHVEVIAPAAGKVVFARNDVPDEATSAEYLRRVNDPKSAIGGNLVLIDHGQGEVSLLAHMAQGSVQVRTGDIVQQGQTLGLIGSAGSGDGYPHLHYQLQAGPGIFEDDGLPIQFTNVYQTGFFKLGPVPVINSGPYYEAR